MGYLISVPTRSLPLRKKMLAFLDENFRHAWEFMDWLDSENPMPAPASGRVICTYAKAHQIGWYKNAGWDLEHTSYADCLLRWIALKVGKSIDLKADYIEGYGELTVPFTLYEHRPVPLITTSECPHALDGWVEGGYQNCDDLGWARSTRAPLGLEEPDPESYLGHLRYRANKADPLVRIELERLDALWEAL